MSWFAIGIDRPKTEANVGTLFRSALAFGAAYVFVIGRRYEPASSDTVKSWKQIPLFEYPDFETFLLCRPRDCPIVGVEYPTPEDKTSFALPEFEHPMNCIYLLGAEDNGLSKKAKEKCNSFCFIPSSFCLNVASAGSIVLYDRKVKNG